MKPACEPLLVTALGRYLECLRISKPHIRTELPASTTEPQNKPAGFQQLQRHMVTLNYLPRHLMF